MSRDSNINQFIPLHFYEVSEKLPDDELEKIVIVRGKYMGDLVSLSHYVLYTQNKKLFNKWKGNKL